MTVYYEWDIELYDASVEDGDIVDHNHANKLVEYDDYDLRNALTRWKDDKEQATRLVLVRTNHFIISRGINAGADSSSRMWAYVENGKLPATFDENPEGVRVQERFHREFRMMLERIKETS